MEKIFVNGKLLTGRKRKLYVNAYNNPSQYTLRGAEGIPKNDELNDLSLIISNAVIDRKREEQKEDFKFKQ